MENREQMEIAFGLVAVVGVGIALAVPEVRSLGVGLCLLSVVASAWLYWKPFLNIPFWFLSRRIKCERVRTVIRRDTIISLFVVALGLGIPIYVEFWRLPEISLQRYALFWIEHTDNSYQIGVIAKLFNNDAESYEFKKFVYDSHDWTLIPHGGYNIAEFLSFLENSGNFEAINDLYIEPHKPAYYKILLPTKFTMTVNGGSAPEVILRKHWYLEIRYAIRTLKLHPRLYTSYPKFISIDEWNALQTIASKINVDNLNYKLPPRRPSPHAQDAFYLVYGRDDSLTIDDPYMCYTPIVKGKNGIMTFVASKTGPPEGWNVLGTTYNQIWSNAETRDLYNSIFAPSADGSPRPFGFIAGREAEMMGSARVAQMSAPTTSCADVLDFHAPY